jgi:predicted ATP-grasp superfamily ATP-dependent carboligase
MSLAQSKPPAIIIGGGANALSVARNLGRIGVAVYVLNEPDAFVRHSRFCRWLDAPPIGREDCPAAWIRFLLGPGSDFLRGAVILSCSDEGIEMIAAHRAQLAERFLLDDSNPAAQLQMLNKMNTYQAALNAGIPTPKFWIIDSPGQLQPVREELVYPLVVKPRLSHVYEGVSGKKLIVAKDYPAALAATTQMLSMGSECLLMEMIPGPDDRLCSYYTYLDEQSRPLFHFTKRIIRRYPVLRGTACYHVTDWIPQAMELGNRLFRHVGLRGLANVEFKHDPRDGQLKLIECNARFTASDCLVARSGFNLAVFVYCRLTARPIPPMQLRAKKLRLWDPIRDFQAYLELRRTEQITFARWLASVLHTQTFPFFQVSDPLPAAARLLIPLRKRLRSTRFKRGAGAASFSPPALEAGA